MSRLELIGADVIAVSDGDSLVVNVGDREKRVRLAGINAPELSECLGIESQESLSDLVGHSVTLALDADNRDQFNRLVAQVIASDVNVNLAQVEAGLAIAVSLTTPYFDEFLAAEGRSQSAARGIWSPESCGGRPIAKGLEIVGISANPPGPDDLALDMEVVEIANMSSVAVDLSGFSLRDESTANRFEFPTGSVLRAGQSLDVVTGCDPSPGQLGWCSEGPVWNNQGDTALLLDQAGRIVDHLRYR